MTPEHDANDVPVEQSIDFGRIWDRIASKRQVVIRMTLVATLVMAGIAFLLPNWYQGDVSIMPPSEDISFGLGNLLKGIGVPGVKVPTQATPAEVFKAILESRRINERIVERFGLKKLYRKKYMIDALKELRRHVKVRVDDVGMILISAEDRDPQRAADLANAYAEELDRYNRESRMTRGSRTRAFIGSRLDSTRRELKAAEDRLAAYESAHKTVALSSESSSSVNAAAWAYANRAALGVRLGVLRDISRETTDEERSLLAQMAQLDRQIEAMPVSGLGVARLLRDVKVGEQLYLLLSAQYEDARITETRDVATVEVLDRATRPEKKSRPHRLQLVAIGFVFGLVASVAYAGMNEPAAGTAARS